ncbi:MAG: hypothetical protein JXR77_04510 [Lentisphaeria bacterium]|nr:hypothetical protein [Lentisphaeria bacterium]
MSNTTLSAGIAGGTTDWGGGVRRLVLVWVLRLMGMAELSAVVAVFLPAAWMGCIHEFLGLGAFAAASTTVYLARHLSAMYVVHGGFLWVASVNPEGHLPLVRYVGASGLVFSVFITVLDVWHGFPWYWMLAEGPGLTVCSGIILWCARGIAGRTGTGRS